MFIAITKPNLHIATEDKQSAIAGLNHCMTGYCDKDNAPNYSEMMIIMAIII